MIENMKHKNHFEIQADSYYELGLRQGELFGKHLIATLAKEKRRKGWKTRFNKSKRYLAPTKAAFPYLIEELEGYAQAAGVPFLDLWTLSLENEVADKEKCTTVITNRGRLIAHNEDWDVGAEKSVCVLKKTVKNLTVLELFYFNTLGGNSVSINSHGIIQAINSLSHTDHRIGIPHNVIARWLSETSNPRKDFWKLNRLPKASGYSHNLIDLRGRIWSIESTAMRQKMPRVRSPFVHTNHYLTDLQAYEKKTDREGTMDRYDFAHHHVKPDMTLAALKKLMRDYSRGKKMSVFNERTNSQMIVDSVKHVAYIWLLREADKGWIKYDLDFLKR
jgi:predicted choloylglycine hydrolase